MSRNRLTLSISWALRLVPICSIRLSADNATNSPDDSSVNSTGFTFPLKVGAFTRVRVTPFNANASDVGVDYNDEPVAIGQ